MVHVTRLFKDFLFNKMNSYYTWITNDIAIGELNASYVEFDTIVNLAYINPFVSNGVEHGKLTIKSNANKKIYCLGVYDTDNDTSLFIELIGKVIFDISKKILFHCQAGKSRSVCMALAYLCIKEKMSVDDGIRLIKEKRPIVNPRPLFVEAVKKFIDVNM